MAQEEEREAWAWRTGCWSVLCGCRRADIQALLKSLPEDQLYTLILLMYVGRGDFSADQLLSAYQTMKDTFPSKDLAIAQMTGKGTLAEYLTDALEEIQKRNIDLDSLKFTSTAGVS